MPEATPLPPMSSVPLRQLKDLPGPRGWPLLGNTLQVKPPRIHRDVERWAAEFGPLFRMRLGRLDQLVIADHELLAGVMRDRPEGFRRSPFASRVGAEMGLPQGLFSAEGEDWRKQRRMVMAAFAPGHVRAYFPSLVKVMLRLRGRWRNAARAGQAIPLQADLMRYTVDAIAGLAFGKDINTLESGEDVIQRHLDQVLPAVFRRVLSIVPYWRWFKRAADRELDASVAVINATILDIVAQARNIAIQHPLRREYGQAKLIVAWAHEDHFQPIDLLAIVLQAVNCLDHSLKLGFITLLPPARQEYRRSRQIDIYGPIGLLGRLPVFKSPLPRHLPQSPLADRK